MNESTSPNSAHRRRSPVRDASTPQMRAVRKELLLLRAEVERAEFVQARMELHRKFANFGWIKLLVPGFGVMRGKRSGRGVNASISDWVLQHPLVSSLASIALGKPLRATVAAGAKPVLKWGAIGAAAWAGVQAWSHFSRKRDEHREQDEASDES
ncbi:DUF3318 domain-containing protein [Trinickia dinghuensis]|uniref:DUF3318 domain-containing protein n=1 Tax=Trinickia dinghuensis TaxID=2291023 RepID=A0A3D8JS67_9BURK|nr:DUF3318 domain-containing protein [Trinickia dinghuensis]RDU95963.1 DUF3318 domain-containing protein [Trinickia dinghuensis]